jgi:UDP-N-acetylmuramate: L-alanyl-gamma-D-glutamyl-meso-diaminopimelate ligase
VHLHILGICGTFMGGIAALAEAAGHRVTGSDQNVYPPMSTQLESLGIALYQGYEAAQLAERPDLVVVGNALSRGNPVVEAMLEQNLDYCSGPEWLRAHVLRDRWVLAVAGTHGKTTTASLLAYFLERAGLAPGFLIGGIARDFGVSARLGAKPCFVVEADEYDTAFFDKRAKFVHYRPRTAILNNLEHDHADIYPDVASIRRQFHHLVRTVPGGGRLIVNGDDAELATTLAMGAWTPVLRFGRGADCEYRLAALAPDWSSFEVKGPAGLRTQVASPLLGPHSAANALAAMLAAEHAGVPFEASSASLADFQGVKRRLEVRGVAGGVTVYDDFAHHPTAIATTLAGLKARIGTERVLAVLEPRSNTMKLGLHQHALADSLAVAERSFLYAPPGLGWDLKAAIAPLGTRAEVHADLEALSAAVAAAARPGDHVLVMSNGGFGGVHTRLLADLAARTAHA